MNECEIEGLSVDSRISSWLYELPFPPSSLERYVSYHLTNVTLYVSGVLSF